MRGQNGRGQIGGGRIGMALGLLIVVAPLPASADEYVPGHMESDGHYIPPHWSRGETWGKESAWGKSGAFGKSTGWGKSSPWGNSARELGSSGSSSDKYAKDDKAAAKKKEPGAESKSYSLYDDPYYAYRPPVPSSRSDTSIYDR